VVEESAEEALISVIENNVEIGDETLKKDFIVCDYGKFKKYLDKAKEILYIGDNAGESVLIRF
jgi:uncharacterized protein with ATP-grasp and redox domains